MTNSKCIRPVNTEKRYVTAHHNVSRKTCWKAPINCQNVFSPSLHSLGILILFLVKIKPQFFGIYSLWHGGVVSQF